MCRTDFDEAWVERRSWTGRGTCIDCGWKGPMLYEELGPEHGSYADAEDLVLSDCVSDWSPEWADQAWKIADGIVEDGYGVDTSVQAVCANCLQARRWLQVWCRSWMYGDYRGDIIEHWDEAEIERTLPFGRLVVAAKTRWKPRGRRLPVEAVAALVDRSLERLRSDTGLEHAEW